MKITLNENIRTFRKERGLTQEQLAEAMGVTVGAVSKWESGQSDPGLSVLVELANFFETSVDVLLGYGWEGFHMGEAAEKIRKLMYEKNYEEGRRFAKRALLKYPNSFEVVCRSAEFFYMSGLEGRRKADLETALPLFERSVGLLSQNRDNSISEATIQQMIGNVYASMEDYEKAVEHWKKYNVAGINNVDIGTYLSKLGKKEEAQEVLSETLMKHVSALIRICNGYMGCLDGDSIEEPLAMCGWMLAILRGMEIPGKVSWLHKLEAMTLLYAALLYAKAGQRETARGMLEQAYETAFRFDEKPDYGMENVRFYKGKEARAFDDMGISALQGIERTMEEEEDYRDYLKEMWEEIRHGR